MSSTASLSAGMASPSSKLFYFYHPTVTRSPSNASTSSNMSTSSSSGSSPSPSQSSTPSTSTWSPSLSSITTEESYFTTQRSPKEKATMFAPASSCKSTCRCTRCCLGDFVFDSEDDYRDYLEVIAQAQQAGARLDQSATRTSALAIAAASASVARSSSCPPIAPTTSPTN